MEKIAKEFEEKGYCKPRAKKMAKETALILMESGNCVAEVQERFGVNESKARQICSKVKNGVVPKKKEEEKKK